VLVASRRMTPPAPRRSVVLLPLALRTSGRGAQGVVPVLGPCRRPLAHDGLGARVRLLHLRPQLVTAGVVVEAAMHERLPCQPLVDLPTR